MHRELLEQIDTEIVTEGTVFQTAILVMFIIPRLRPGLLSLRSVLASSQNYPQPITNNQ